MILVRAPLRISFVGGGTDLPGFYRQYPGRVISTTIDKYVYVAINSTPLIDKLTVKYQQTESVTHPRELKHPSIKAALMDLGITEQGIEIGSFADLPARTGLGSSSSFAVALLKGLHAYLGKKMSKEEAACAACRLEIELLKEPIGKQDQYAAAHGGFNRIQFNADETVSVDPIFLDYEKRLMLGNHVLVFFTGITRSASRVLRTQAPKISDRIETYKKMSDSVFDFEEMLLRGDMERLALMLHEGWEYKKSLSPHISNSLIDNLYKTGIESGVWGGKVLGAGGGGCVLFIAPPKKHPFIRRALTQAAKKNQLGDFREIPVSFVQSGVDILLNSHFR